MGRHPAQYSPEVIEALRPLIRPGEVVHDPFSGPGLRLGALCDELDAFYTGTDIEWWPGSDPRVTRGDAKDPKTYPGARLSVDLQRLIPFTVVTSPVYLNKRLADYANGPTPNTKVKGRRDYGIALGHELHPENLARYTGRESRAKDYWRLHGEVVKHWGGRALVNVDQPISDRWVELLAAAGLKVKAIYPVYTQRYGGLANADKRAAYEVVIVAERDS